MCLNYGDLIAISTNEFLAKDDRRDVVEDLIKVGLGCCKQSGSLDFLERFGSKPKKILQSLSLILPLLLWYIATQYTGPCIASWLFVHRLILDHGSCPSVILFLIDFLFLKIPKKFRD